MRTLRLKDLHRYGYIDHPSGPIDAAEDKFQVFNVDRQDVRATAESTGPDESHGITHPLFKRTNWIGLTDADYELIKPSLRLASKLLAETYVLRFFQALLHRPLGILDDPGSAKLNNHPMHFFGVRNIPQDPEYLVKTVQTLHALQAFVTFKFETGLAGWGVTGVPSIDKDGLYKK